MLSILLMAIEYNREELNAFFGNEGELADQGRDIGRMLMYKYQGETLAYEIWIFIDREEVAISGDPERPFSGDSLFEFYIPVNCITYKSFGGYDKDCPVLVFTDGPTTSQDYKTMDLHRTAKNKLKVWPVYPLEKKTQ